MKVSLRLAMVALAVPALLGAAPAKQGRQLPAPPPRGDWNATVSLTPAGGHLIGNPAAQVKLAEYVSYTCPHCAHFQRQSEGPLRISYIPGGRLSVEVRHLVRDPVDLTAAMLTNCVAPGRFYRLHNAFLLSQEKWMRTLDVATDTQKHRWVNGALASRMRAIAADFGFYPLMEQQGLSRTATDRCLANQALADRLAAQTRAAAAAGVEATPSFMLGDVLLAGTHDWATLELQIKARL